MARFVLNHGAFRPSTGGSARPLPPVVAEAPILLCGLADLVDEAAGLPRESNMSSNCSPPSKLLCRAGHALLVATLVLVGACESPTATEPGPEPLLQTVAQEYGFEPAGGGAQELSVHYTFLNSTDAPVFVGNCNGVFSHGLERLTDQGWQRSWSASLLLCRSEPIQIVPGERWSGEVIVRAVPATALSGADLALADDLSGTYRLVWDMPVTEGPSGEELLPKDLRVSNPFGVRLP